MSQITNNSFDRVDVNTLDPPSVCLAVCSKGNLSLFILFESRFFSVAFLATALASPVPTPVPSSSASLSSNTPRSHINEPPHQDLVPKPKQENENQEAVVLPKLELLHLLERSEADAASDGRRAELTDSDITEYANPERELSGNFVLKSDSEKRQALDGVHPNGVNAGIGGFRESGDSSKRERKPFLNDC